VAYLDVSFEPDHEIRDQLDELLTAFNREHRPPQAGTKGAKAFAVVLKSDNEPVLGGLWANIYADWMFVELLFVPEPLRGQAFGTQLLMQAEDHAKSLGLVGMWLDTYSFQARPFYERHGFEVFGQLDDFPIGGTRYFLKKKF
jgi:GNAT superfamily N-acetyltransferase